MKVFMPFVVKDIGGPSSFATKFKSEMEALGDLVVFELCPDYDVMLVIVQCPWRFLWHAKRFGKKIVQRLDGTYYFSVAGWKFPLLNLKAAIVRHIWADATAYQSEYSKVCANRFLGPKQHERSSTIYNGADITHFAPTGHKKLKRDNPKQQIFFTASAFRRTDQILPILAALKHYKHRYNDNFVFYIAGSFSAEVKSIPDEFGHLPYVRFLGKINNTDLPDYLRSADAFLFTHLNPPCPNNIVEALACGVPICGVADGSMPELVTRSGILLPTRGAGFWRRRIIDSRLLAHNLQRLMLQRRTYARRARIEAIERLSSETMAKNYRKLLQELLG